ncbi:hypothetical protein O9G_001085 [Rozella allomycis CSF55]|uniref:mRNA cap guanine-N(7) methyltransferase n=1 Tax=Rozella allomycis (strain CSF55) TaxID=988480 RepID=A0A075AN19_ROZAC|nr:hypothetical protein O9G_001085 [Rozella allomycis CSF55]|eukprot:EPZ31174.1 hypothetical protein O9G_001085 [Rozella allomycis CSF55]
MVFPQHIPVDLSAKSVQEATSRYESMRRKPFDAKFRACDAFSITFADEEEEKKEFGCEYTFNLKEAVESVPEYLVYKETLERIAREEGLELVYWKNFTEMYYDFCAEEPFQSMLTRMNVLNKQGSIDPEDWEVIALYSSFAFKKK